MSTAGAAVERVGLSGLETLAAAVSIAVRVEPELTRAVRLEVLPTLDVGHEADLWFSDWVLAREPGGIIFKDDARHLLQAKLADMLRCANDDDKIWTLWDVFHRVHRQISPALRLEEHVTWLAIAGGDSARAAIDEQLRQAVRALGDEDRRQGILDWFTGALIRLPGPVRATQAAWVLQQALRLPGAVEIERSPMSAAGLSPSDLAEVVHLLPDVRLMVQRRGHSLDVGDMTPTEDSVAILVPDTNPRILDVLPEAGSGYDGQGVAVDSGQTIAVTVGPGPVRIRTARGLVYEIEGTPDETPAFWSGGSGSSIFLSHAAADAHQAVALKRWLAERRPELADAIFLDLDPETGVRPGQRWALELRRASARCEAVICLVSRSWEASVECKTEYRTAEALGKPVVVARLDDVASTITSEWQRVDLFAEGPTTTISVAGTSAPVAFNTAALHQLERAVEASATGPENFVWPPRHDPMRSPYRGWQPVEEIDAGVYFGRGAEIVHGLDELRNMRFSGQKSLFVILGPSGSGKSSYLRAGLIPRLRRDDRNFLLLGIMRPERNALTGRQGLAAAIFDGRRAVGFTGTALADIKQACTDDRGPELVYELLMEVRTAGTARLSESGASAPTLVLPLDQAEELFTADAGPQAERFLRVLADVQERINADKVRLIVAATISTDRYEAMQNHPALAGVGTVLFVDLKPMPTDAFHDVIRGPAARATQAGHPLTIAGELVARLLSDASEGADTLPLLALTLERLYMERGATGNITLADYESIGGMRDVVNNEIEQILPPDPHDRESALALLRSAFIPLLVTINPDTGQPMRRVARQSDLPHESRPLIEALIEKRLLVRDERDGQVVVEVALQSLLRHWTELVGWLSEEHDSLKTADDILGSASAWETHDRDPAWLLTGTRLAGAEHLAATPPFSTRLAHIRDYLAACRNAEDDRIAVEEELRQARLREAKARQAAAEAATREASRSRDMQYDAFLSYSHRDLQVANGIRNGLHEIGRRRGQLRALRVFRDDSNLVASPDLWGRITEAMESARFMIVVLSPQAGQSSWANMEIRYWLEHRGQEQMMLVLAGGQLRWDSDRARFDPELSNAAPPVLTQPGVLAVEPLYIDVSDDAPWDVRSLVFRDKLTSLAAPIHAKTKDELAGEDQRERRRFWPFRRS